jgi:hypothetical protein
VRVRSKISWHIVLIAHYIDGDFAIACCILGHGGARATRSLDSAIRPSDFVALGELPDVIGRSEGKRLNGHGRLAAA